MSIHFKECFEHKVMRDTVHGYIHVNYQLIWDLINAPEFQRLRRIHQLGGTSMVYHTAEHSRFSHSLGVYEVVRQMIEKVSGLGDVLSEYERVSLLCAGLLHDIGHGPYSHAFEAVTDVNHETFTDRIILEDTHINRILTAVDAQLPQVVSDIIAHRHERALLTQIISSQLDADRMDYLLRDSYFTGVSYGEFDLQRILRTMIVVDDRIVMKESGIHAVEDYIMARYQMYWQVYLHPTSRSFEGILLSIFNRMKDLTLEDSDAMDCVSFFKPFVREGSISLQSHYELDESTCISGFMTLTKSDDAILRDLASRLLNRVLFQYVDFESDEQLQKIENAVNTAGYDTNYYVVKDFTTQTLYQTPYEQNVDSEIYVSIDGKLVELSQASSIVRGFVMGEAKEDRKVFYPKEIRYE
ncbi:HD domain-containing protein [Erysipelothrix sp. HDW6C]|uniref:HD domain-containing protein n=1 Tax=Erysipelothrix sp. HDW6C TaxID=2714930 RepID=UPI0014099215|nr:HD domain-containing protein [Erysipelothrix sp. HDW6C]QIK69002.1 HD domain-containing protein [Erysipelothrix sp. HDW6C]